MKGYSVNIIFTWTKVHSFVNSFLLLSDRELLNLTWIVSCQCIIFPFSEVELKRPWFWERLSAGGEGDDRGGDSWMVSLTQWTWVWVNSGSWWWTWRPGMLQSMGSQRVGHDWATELNCFSFDFNDLVYLLKSRTMKQQKFHHHSYWSYYVYSSNHFCISPTELSRLYSMPVFKKIKVKHKGQENTVVLTKVIG